MTALVLGEPNLQIEGPLTLSSGTWMCSMGDIHANNTGYGELAEAFVAELED